MTLGNQLTHTHAYRLIRSFTKAIRLNPSIFFVCFWFWHFSLCVCACVHYCVYYMIECYNNNKKNSLWSTTITTTSIHDDENDFFFLCFWLNAKKSKVQCKSTISKCFWMLMKNQQNRRERERESGQWSWVYIIYHYYHWLLLSTGIIIRLIFFLVSKNISSNKNCMDRKLFFYI